MRVTVSSILPSVHARAFSGSLLAATLGACGGLTDPSTVQHQSLSTLSDDDARAICAYNVRRYREQLPMDRWDTPYCAGATLFEQKARGLLLGAADRDTTVRQCRERLAACLGAPTYEVWEPERDCQRVDPASARQCTATVGELQRCMAERIERAQAVGRAVESRAVCDAPDPLKSVSLTNGPACQKLLSRCDGFTLLWPGRIREVK